MRYFRPSPPVPTRTATVGETVLAADAAMERQDWAAAAEGYMRVRKHLAERTPKPIFAHAAVCLHRAGRLREAEKCAREGLGREQDLIAIKGDLPSERELLARWPSNAAPLVSIVCITYNHERYIGDTFRGFFTQQTDFPFEILIHDDASTDGTAELIRKWQARYPSIIRSVLQTENQMSQGVCPINALLPMARGQYVATCEGDDYWIEPTKLLRQVRFLEQHPEFSCSAHNYYLYSEKDLSIRPWSESRRDFLLTGRQLMCVNQLLWLLSLVFRKTFTQLPPERSLTPIGDQLITSYLGTLGQCAYFDSMIGAVRRANPFSIWMPLPAAEKEAVRVKNWLALIQLHERLGHSDVVEAFRQRIKTSRLDEAQKADICQQFQELPALQPEPVS